MYILKNSLNKTKLEVFSLENNFSVGERVSIKINDIKYC